MIYLTRYLIFPIFPIIHLLIKYYRIQVNLNNPFILDCDCARLGVLLEEHYSQTPVDYEPVES